MPIERISQDKLTKKEWDFSFMGQSGKKIVLTRYTEYGREDVSKKWSRKLNWDFHNRNSSDLTDQQVPLPQDVSDEVYNHAIADYRVLTANQFLNSL